MIKRTKLLIFIIVPDMSLLPVDTIMATKISQKVTIASPQIYKPLADELIEKPNVDIRVITEMDVSVIAANRDQEEAFYGPMTKNPNEMVCSITQQDELIKIIAENISYLYRGRSHKYA
jgi:hypothetical protein